jgi:hypothetical protein
MRQGSLRSLKLTGGFAYSSLGIRVRFSLGPLAAMALARPAGFGNFVVLQPAQTGLPIPLPATPGRRKGAGWSRWAIAVIVHSP